MIIPIPIFMPRETELDIKIRGKINEQRHYLEIRKNLRKDIAQFKSNFIGTEFDNPYMCYLKRHFPNKNIDELTLKDLLLLGFNSDNITREMLEEKNEKNMV